MSAMPLAPGLFVTGTDTGVGKSWVSAALLRALASHGLRVQGMKPVASGCSESEGSWRNDDALLLMEHSDAGAEYGLVNPYAFAEPVSPHIAAQQTGLAIDLGVIEAAYRRLAEVADVVVVEGVGGWLAPLGPDACVADLARRLNLPVVLVVGMRLGCINHALLTASAVAQSGLPLLGWVANVVEREMAYLPENVCSISERIDAPCLGLLPHTEYMLGETWLSGAAIRLAEGLRNSGFLQWRGA